MKHSKNKLKKASRALGADKVRRLLRRTIGHYTTVKPTTAPPHKYPDTVDILKYRLYNLGFQEKALADLKSILVSSSYNEETKSSAAWEIVLWYANKPDAKSAAEALKYIGFASAHSNDAIYPERIALIKAECLARINKKRVSLAVIDEYLSTSNSIDLSLMAVNLQPNVSSKLNYLNSIYLSNDLSTIKLKPGDDPVYDRLVPSNSKIIESPIKVSVIIPVFNSEKYIITALESLLTQSWQNLEIIVVDDCSSDKTAAVVKSYSKKDHRIKLMRNGVNSGPYVARNNALRIATGDFVTVCDADDWSHPDKIAYQAKALIEKPDCIANVSQWARSTNELVFYRRGNPGFYMQLNISSLMLRRERLLGEFGYWDSVRFGADTELYHRIKRTLGAGAIDELDPVPLSIGRHAESSLTNSSAFGYPGFLIGARKVYSEMTSYNLNINKSLKYEFPMRVRPFYAPRPMRIDSHKDDNDHFDILYVADFSDTSNIVTKAALKDIKSLRGTGAKLGIVQASKYRGSQHRLPIREILQSINVGLVETIVYGETVSSDLLLADPEIVAETQIYLPQISSTRSVFLTNGNFKDIDIDSLNKNSFDYFKTKPTWCAVDNSTEIDVDKLGSSNRIFPAYSHSWQDITTPIYHPSISNIQRHTKLSSIVNLHDYNPFHVGSKNKIHIVDTARLSEFSFGDNEITIIMPCIDIDKGRVTAEALVRRAGMKCTVVIAVDSVRQGFIKTLNDASMLSNARYIIYLAEDAFPGRDWLRIAYNSIEESGKGLLGFNDGKWHGRIASFGMIRKSWIQKFYNQELLSSAYKSHKADNEITVLAKADNMYIYEPDSLLAENDFGKDFKGSNKDDDAIFERRFLSGFEGSIDFDILEPMKAEYKIYQK